MRANEQMQRVSDQLGAPRVTPAMWEQRRYEIARDIYANSLQREYLLQQISPDDAVKKADRLIDALKKPKQ